MKKKSPSFSCGAIGRARRQCFESEEIAGGEAKAIDGTEISVLRQRDRPISEWASVYASSDLNSRTVRSRNVKCGPLLLPRGSVCAPSDPLISSCERFGKTEMCGARELSMK